MYRANVDGAATAVRAAARAGVPRLVHTSSAASLGEVTGTVGSEASPHRGWFLSDYERSKHEGEGAVLAAAREPGQAVCVNPSSVQGPGRAGGTGRFLLALLDGRLNVFLQRTSAWSTSTTASRATCWRPSAGAGERYLLNGMTLTIAEALALIAGSPASSGTRACCRPVARRRGARRGRSASRAGGRRCAGRWCARCCTATATTAPAPRASSACATRPARDRPADGRVGALGRPAAQTSDDIVTRRWTTSATIEHLCSPLERAR